MEEGAAGNVVVERHSTGRRLLRREERQAAILRGAAAAFARSGFAATSMDDVATECGVSRLILYRHFEGKEELYRAVLQRVFVRQAEELVRALESGNVRGLGFRTLLTVAREQPDGFTLLWRHAAREPQFAEYAREQREAAVDAVLSLMALDSGDAMLDRFTGELVYGWLVEGVLTWLEIGDHARDEEAIERAATMLRAMRSSLLLESRPVDVGRPTSSNPGS
jgi:AcrR family transcriptional regulator